VPRSLQRPAAPIKRRKAKEKAKANAKSAYCAVKFQFFIHNTIPKNKKQKTKT
jgi:hypothetical protein